MTSQSLTSIEFEAIINANHLVFVDFWAAWCAPCKQFSQAYEQVAALYPHIVFTKVNIEEQQQLTEMFGIRSIPHLMIFKEGIVIYSDAGSIPAFTLEALVQQAEEFDVNEIKVPEEE